PEITTGALGAAGRSLASEHETYPIAADATTGAAEQDPEAWWAALAAATRRARAASRGASVEAICVVGQGPTLLAVDAWGRATHPAITWMDGRPAAEAASLEAATGLAGWGLGILPAARWLEVHADAAEVDRTNSYLNSWEWAAFRLCGRAVATRSLGQAHTDPA